LALWVANDIDLKSPRDVARELFQNAESIVIVAAVVLYFKEIPDRKTQRHYDAWQVIDNAAVATQVSGEVFTSYARKKALEDLCKDGVSLSSIDVPRADLSGINLSGAKLLGANFNGANLSAVDFSGAKLLQATFNGADLSGAKFCGANLRDAKFLDSTINLDGAYLNGPFNNDPDILSAERRKVDFSNSDLRGANFRNSQLCDSDFSGADLFGADLSGADFTGSNFRDAILRGADLSGTNFSCVQNLSLQQIRSASNWKNAEYDPAYEVLLGFREVNSPFILDLETEL
jgi:BTB/POZ domain-containing protein KCTD9